MASQVQLSHEPGSPLADSYSPESIERRWQAAWRTQRAFATPAKRDGRVSEYILADCVVPAVSLSGEVARTFVIADAYARFQRARGRDVLFSVGFDSFGGATAREAERLGVSPREWARDACERNRRQLEALGCSCDWERTFVSSEPDCYRWTQWLFLELLERRLVFRRGPRWFMRVNASSDVYGADGDERPDSSSDAPGRVDGVELTATTLGRGDLTVFTPHSGAIDKATFVAVSPAHRDLAGWEMDRAHTQQIAAMRDAVCELENASTAATADVLLTDVLATVPGVAGLLPVVISPLVDVRFGATAVLGIPELDLIDRALAEHLPSPSHGMKWKVSGAKAVARPAVRFPVRVAPVSREHAWGTPVPVVDCSACGPVPVPRERLPLRPPEELGFGGECSRPAGEDSEHLACACPRCGGSARRDPSTIGRRFDRMGTWMAACTAPEQRATASLNDPGLARWLPVARVVTSAASTKVTEQRGLAELLQDAGALPALPGRDPFVQVLNHAGMLGAPDYVLDSLTGESRQPVTPYAGGDAVRLAILSGAAPERIVGWSDQYLQQSQRFLLRMFAFAEPRLRAWTQSPRPTDGAHIDTSDKLRRRLAHWCATARKKVTSQLEAAEPQRATLSAMRLLKRIEDFETMAQDGDGRLRAEDQEAVVSALQLLVRLLAPLTPHLAEELWSRAGYEAETCAAAWPAPSRPE
jgi:leucyl-tRNA synthetase